MTLLGHHRRILREVKRGWPMDPVDDVHIVTLTMWGLMDRWEPWSGEPTETRPVRRPTLTLAGLAYA